MDKAYILREIRRTAEENNGVPLGWRKFLSATGIKKYDWLGKYWARWSDAIREAGFAPNKMEAPYDRGVLFDQYAALAQALGRLPASDDLRLKVYTEPRFPSEKTFRRLGTKSALARQLLDHCRTRSGYEDVVRMCGEYASRHRALRDEPGPVVQDGFVYLIKSGRFYKIGKTNAAGRREYELDIQLPEDVRTIHVIRTDDPGGIEAYWHKRFETKRKKGEWFELTAADVAAFKRRKFM
jgi:hypothetical protein